ncbi:MAG: hypothetical protein QOK31_720 [Solirubrobacteraceae bacterium]|nr:hypothetical protein [Solirubrobacteraceae bacterium]
MSEHTLTRTIVKSPPELWAEISDPAALANHLGEFGEIRVTRIEQDSSVSWEGERASGTVELEPVKWGTRVKLTARPHGEEPAVAVAPEPTPEPETAPAPAAATRRGLFARLRKQTAASPAAPTEPQVADPVPTGEGPADPGTVAVLFAMLDSLGSATHRPFSRG